MDNPPGTVREQIVAALPNLLKKALDDYEKLLEKGPGENPKAHYEACKAALAHIALFVKTAEQVDTNATGEGRQKFLEDLLAGAQKELSDQGDSIE